jgi:hypothetical protein
VLKINLLPPYIFERRKVRQAAVLAGVAFVAVLAGMLGWWYVLGKTKAELTVQVQDMEQKRDRVIALQQLAKAEADKIPPIEAKVSFIKGMLDYNDEYPKLYEEVFRYTYGRVLYRSISPSSDTLTIQVYARSLGDCGRYLLNMYRATHLFSSVSVSAVPGYPSARGGGFDFTVTCRLLKPITAPTYGSVGTTSTGQQTYTGGPAAPTSPGAPPAPATPGGSMPSTQEFQQAESAPPPGWEGGE